MSSFSALLKTIGDRKGLPVTVHLEDDRLSINAGDQALGDWPLSEIHLEPIATGYRMDAEGEQILIELQDSEAFELELHKKPPRTRVKVPSAGNLMKSVDSGIEAAENRFGRAASRMGLHQNHVWRGHWGPSNHGHPPRYRVDVPSDHRAAHRARRGGGLDRHRAGLQVASRSHDADARPAVWCRHPHTRCHPRRPRQLDIPLEKPGAPSDSRDRDSALTRNA